MCRDEEYFESRNGESWMGVIGMTLQTLVLPQKSRSGRTFGLRECDISAITREIKWDNQSQAADA